jgi:hypothetical protein
LELADFLEEEQMNRSRLGAAWAGLSLISLGIVLLVAQWFGWERIWPVFPLLGGLAFLVGFGITGFKNSGLVFVGVAATLVGLFFFGFTLGFWEWGDMAKLWPVFPLMGGVAFAALFLAERARDMGTLGVGCAAMIVGVVGLTLTYGFVATDIIKFWPLLLVLVGLISLIGVLLQIARRE